MPSHQIAVDHHQYPGVPPQTLHLVIIPHSPRGISLNLGFNMTGLDLVRGRTTLYTRDNNTYKGHEKLSILLGDTSLGLLQ